MAQGNVADETQVAEAGKKEKSKRLQEKAELRRLLELPEFRRFMWRVLGFCGIFRISWSNSGSETSFNEGMRNVGLKIRTEIFESKPEALTQMEVEASKQEENSNA